MERKETILVARIKIEKLVKYHPYRAGTERKDLMWTAYISMGRGGWNTSFNEKTKQKFWKHLREEVFL